MSKRERKRPSEWWANAASPATPRIDATHANATAESQQDAKRRKLNPSNGSTDGNTKPVASAIAQQDQESGKRGPAPKTIKTKATLPFKSTTQSISANPVRRGRSSNTEAEVRSINYKETATKQCKHDASHGQSKGAEPDSQSSKASNKSSTRKTNQKDLRASFIKTNSSIASDPPSSTLVQRRGRPSNTEAELRAVNYKEAATRTRRNAEEQSTVSQKQNLLESKKVRQKQAKSMEDAANGVRQNHNGDTSRPNGARELARSQGRPRNSSPRAGKFRKRDKHSTRAIFKTSQSKNAKPSQVRKGKDTDATRTNVKSHSGGVKAGRKSHKGSATNSVPQQRVASVLEQEIPRDEQRRDDQDLAQYLAATTRLVSRNAIESKWEPLPTASIDLIAQTLHDMQAPVVARLRDGQQQSQAVTALHTISRRLVSKISKGLPFPPSTRLAREDDFDFEKVLDKNRELANQLTPAIHSNRLLEAELAKELRLLEEENRHLGILEDNAKAESSKRKQETRALHHLLGTDDHGPIHSLESQSPKHYRGSAEDLQRAVVPTVIQSLMSHVDSIEHNVQQIGRTAEGIWNGKAAVQGALLSRLTSAQYEAMIGVETH